MLTFHAKKSKSLLYKISWTLSKRPIHEIRNAIFGQFAPLYPGNLNPHQPRFQTVDCAPSRDSRAVLCCYWLAVGRHHGPLPSLRMGLQVRTLCSPIWPILANVVFSGGSQCVRGRQLGDRLITFNRQDYVVADLKRVWL